MFRKRLCSARPFSAPGVSENGILMAQIIFHGIWSCQMESLYIVIPAYNEEENIKHVIQDWYPVVERHAAGGVSRLLVIDDGSRDRTYEILQEFCESYPLLEVVTKPNAGHGATLLFGYHYALKHGADYIFQTDSDGQTLPEEFEPFWEQRKQWDFLIGRRWHRQDGKGRIFVTRVLRLVIWLTFRVWTEDANTPYRLMHADTLRKVLRWVPEDFHLSNVLSSVLYCKGPYRVKYLPITFRPRQGGVNSINFKKIFRIGLQALREFRNIEKALERVGNIRQ